MGGLGDCLSGLNQDVVLFPVPKQNPKQPNTSGHTQHMNWHQSLAWQSLLLKMKMKKKSTASAGKVLHTAWLHNLP